VAIQQFLLPDAGEGLTEAEILTWHVAPGDTVTVNQVIVEIETAKAAVELPCPYAGVVTELLVEPGVTVAVGVPIISIETGSPASGSPAPAAPAAAASTGKIGEEMPGGRIATLVGYGPDGVITRDDVRTASAAPAPEPAAAPALEPAAAPVAPDAPGLERRVPVKGVRKATAAAMVASAFTAPHVTEFLTVDVTPMMELRARLKSHPDFAGLKLTPLAFAAKAVCLAAARTPDVNARFDADTQEIVYFSQVNLGIAAATPRGLMVPNVRGAQALSLAALAAALGELTSTAREGRTPPAAMTGGTFTITNVGVFGVDTGTPIINPGESAILALGAIKPAPWVVDGELAVRTVCQLALSFDHRVVDGQQGSRFLADVGALLADPGLAMTY
jgi:2-oxoisovalerate dehydrogenase E2 component (dihydrolipoyl transacylase)